jgi:flagellar basal body L-ring protein FlgH
MDLGRKRPESAIGAAPQSRDTPEVIYPSFSIEEETAKEFRKAHPDLAVGDFLTFTVRSKVSSMHESAERYDTGERVGFELHSMDGIKAATEEDEHGGETAESESAETEESEGSTGNPAVDRLMKRKG